jgi:hypothetical protein
MSKKKIYKDFAINLACLALLSMCCLSILFIGNNSSQVVVTSQPTFTSTPLPTSTKQEVSVVSNLGTATYTSTPTAINALTPTKTPTPIPTNTAVTPFLLPTRIPSKTPYFNSYYYPSIDYEYDNYDYDYEVDDYSDPGLASAICRDGTLSYSAHRRGTCSHHGGVAQWLQPLPP